MAEDVQSMTFELPKRIQASLDQLRADVGDLKIRMSAIEGHLGQQTIQIGALNGRMDRFDERLARIERRLDLVES